MSKTQRTAILDFHNGVTSKRHSFIAGSRTVAVLVRNGWARDPFAGRSAHVTTAGLIAAGVDMDAIHADALDENEIFDQQATQATPAYRHFVAAVYKGKSYRAALDVLHGEALREHDRRRVAAARQGRPEVLNGTLGGPEMILAVLPLAIEQAHADALDEAAERGPAHVRSNCPALPNGGCVRCTAPAAVRAAHGDESAYRLPAAHVQPGMKVDAMVNGRRVTGRVVSTAHRGLTLIGIGFYSPELGHTNYINDAINVQPEDIFDSAQVQ